MSTSVKTRPFRSPEALATIKHVGGLRPGRVFTCAEQKPRILVWEPKTSCFGSASGSQKPRVFAPLLTTKNFESWGAAKSTQKLKRAAAQGHPEPKRQKLKKTRAKTYVLEYGFGLPAKSFFCHATNASQGARAKARAGPRPGQGQVALMVY